MKCCSEASQSLRLLVELNANIILKRCTLNPGDRRVPTKDGQSKVTKHMRKASTESKNQQILHTAGNTPFKNILLLSYYSFPNVSPFSLLCPAYPSSHSPSPHCYPCPWVIHTCSLSSPLFSTIIPTGITPKTSDNRTILCKILNIFK